MTPDEPLPDIDPRPPAPLEHEDIESGPLATGHPEIDALLDGEPVDKDALRAALDEAAARDYLVDALLLRQLTRDMGPSRFVVSRMARKPFARSMRWLAASAILVAGAAGGYRYGLRSQAAPASSSSVQVLLDDGQPVAPQPTQIIRFERGVNWTNNGSY